ncbi:uncharacterized protein RMCFA_5441 [Mycolicibacterium fortuitum subsp. acetamidolyticum]|uniref:Uncharacterized protein n=1 Tax=Mycolicibacterium fortuitum subsp. acetamidolyticum TaxID=144550 RepID=A0A100WVT0_MYCFO|nr:uncharacterized protein RMCFA_5441 [Mycolicibacterium fortuitum subsp. acetamidolyticum]
MVWPVSEPSMPAVRQKPRGNAELADLMLIVRPHWSKVRTFTDAERDEAEQYAAEHRGIVESLPLSDG